MYYVYFLKSEKDGGLYIGRSVDIARRLAEHNGGQVSSTKSRRPLTLLGYEECEDEMQSVILEKDWKKGSRREELRKRFCL